MSSILDSIKKINDISPDNEDFDTQLIIHTNTAFDVLRQLGVGDDDEPVVIEGSDEEWEDYAFMNDYPIVKTYIPLKVKSLFDPPSGSVLNDAYEKAIKEIEWRIIVDTKK